MKVGMSTSCFFGREKLEDTIDIMGGMGVSCAEIFLNTLSEYEEGFCKELRRRLDENGIEVLSVHPMGVQFEMQMYTPYERTVKDAEDIFKRVLNAANILGAKRYIYHGGLNLKKKKQPISMTRIAEVTGRCARTAAEYGVEFAYENVHWCWFNKPQFARELVGRCKEPNLTFNLDIKQAAQSGYSYEKYLDAMKDRLTSVHLCDHIIDNEGWVKPVAPFEGRTDFKQLKARLDKNGYSGPAILELYAGNYGDYDELAEIYARIVRIFAGKGDYDELMRRRAEAEEKAAEAQEQPTQEEIEAQEHEQEDAEAENGEATEA